MCCLELPYILAAMPISSLSKRPLIHKPCVFLYLKISPFPTQPENTYNSNLKSEVLDSELSSAVKLIFALDLHLVVRCLKGKFLWILLSWIIGCF